MSFEIMKFTNLRGIADMSDLEKKVEEPQLSNDPTKDLQEWREWIRTAITYGVVISQYRQAQGIKRFLAHVYKRCERPEQLKLDIIYRDIDLNPLYLSNAQMMKILRSIEILLPLVPSEGEGQGKEGQGRDGCEAEGCL